jgi:adenylate kinases
MKIILLGPPGAGKGTQAKLLCQKFSLPQISTGDMLRSLIRKENHPLASQIKKTIDSGSLISDSLMMEILEARLKEDDCQKGFLLDGFPRTLEQGKMLHERKIIIDLVLEMDLPEEVLIERMAGRLIHEPSGRTYHRTYNPPKETGYDDITREALITRQDDEEQTVRHRLLVYQKQTAPLIAYYQNLCKQKDHYIVSFSQISGDAPVEKIQENILNICKMSA